MTSSERPATHFMANRHWDHQRISGDITPKMESFSSSMRGMDSQDDHSSDGSENLPVYISGKSVPSSGGSGMDRYISNNMDSDNPDHKSSILDDQARRYRTNYSRSQIARLEDEFRREKYLSRPRRCELAAELGLKETTIKVWFQNRRMKEKRQMASLALPVFANADPNLYAFLMESASAYLSYTANKTSLPNSVSGQPDLYNHFNNSATPTVPISSSSMVPFADHSPPKMAAANIMMPSQAAGRFASVPLHLPGMAPQIPAHQLLTYESNLRHSIDHFRMTSAPPAHPGIPHPLSSTMPYFLHHSLQQNPNCSLPLSLMKFPPSISPVNVSTDNANRYSIQENQTNNPVTGVSSSPVQKCQDIPSTSPKKKLFRPFMQSEDN